MSETTCVRAIVERYIPELTADNARQLVLAALDDAARERDALREERDVNNRCWHDAEDRIAALDERVAGLEERIKLAKRGIDAGMCYPPESAQESQVLLNALWEILG